MSFKNVPIPAAADAAGMTKLVFADDFDSYDTIDMSGEGKPGYNWYADRPYGNPTLTKDDLVIKDSVVTIRPERAGAAVGLPTYSRKGQTGFTYNKGYAEARMRFPVSGLGEVVRGQIPAFWALGVDDVAGRPWNHIGELDILEAVHAHQIDNQVIYTGTLHDHNRLEGPPTKLCTNTINATGYKDQFDVLDDDWHTYAALWDDNYVAWYLDNKLMHSARYAEGEMPQYFYRDDPTPLPPIEEFYPNYGRPAWLGAHTIMNTDNMVLFVSGHRDWPVEVDWVRVWQK